MLHELAVRAILDGHSMRSVRNCVGKEKRCLGMGEVRR